MNLMKHENNIKNINTVEGLDKVINEAKALRQNLKESANLGDDYRNQKLDSELSFLKLKVGMLESNYEYSKVTSNNQLLKIRRHRIACKLF